LQLITIKKETPSIGQHATTVLGAARKAHLNGTGQDTVKKINATDADLQANIFNSSMCSTLMEI
jgi:hypothetical protein